MSRDPQSPSTFPLHDLLESDVEYGVNTETDSNIGTNRQEPSIGQDTTRDSPYPTRSESCLENFNRPSVRKSDENSTDDVNSNSGPPQRPQTFHEVEIGAKRMLRIGAFESFIESAEGRKILRRWLKSRHNWVALDKSGTGGKQIGLIKLDRWTDELKVEALLKKLKDQSRSVYGMPSRYLIYHFRDPVGRRIVLFFSDNRFLLHCLNADACHPTIDGRLAM